mmetsp:Transcript_19800/g.58808  ORF Transcript_19800/g.58808 Transcript_19800/m.58808 type:complete len:236 (-) Transcript_19800:896-1603(-)
MGSTDSSAPTAPALLASIAATRNWKSAAPTSTPSSTYTSALSGSSHVARGSSSETAESTAGSDEKARGHASDAVDSATASARPSSAPICSRRPVRRRAVAGSPSPSATATMVCPAIARLSTSIDAKIHTWYSTWCDAIDVAPSRAATALASVLVPSSTAVRIRTAPPDATNGPYARHATAGLTSGSGFSPRSSRRRHTSARYVPAAAHSAPTVDSAAPSRPSPPAGSTSASDAPR